MTYAKAPASDVIKLETFRDVVAWAESVRRVEMVLGPKAFFFFFRGRCARGSVEQRGET